MGGSLYGVLRHWKRVDDASGGDIRGGYEGCPTRAEIRAVEHNIGQDRPEQATRTEAAIRFVWVGTVDGASCSVRSSVVGVGVRVDDQYSCGSRLNYTPHHPFSPSRLSLQSRLR